MSQFAALRIHQSGDQRKVLTWGSLLISQGLPHAPRPLRLTNRIVRIECERKIVVQLNRPGVVEGADQNDRRGAEITEDDIPGDTKVIRLLSFREHRRNGNGRRDVSHRHERSVVWNQVAGIDLTARRHRKREFAAVVFSSEIRMRGLVPFDVACPQAINSAAAYIYDGGPRSPRNGCPKGGKLLVSWVDRTPCNEPYPDEHR